MFMETECIRRRENIQRGRVMEVNHVYFSTFNRNHFFNYIRIIGVHTKYCFRIVVTIYFTNGDLDILFELIKNDRYVPRKIWFKSDIVISSYDTFETPS